MTFTDLIMDFGVCTSFCKFPKSNYNNIPLLSNCGVLILYSVYFDDLQWYNILIYTLFFKPIKVSIFQGSFQSKNQSGRSCN